MLTAELCCDFLSVQQSLLTVSVLYSINVDVDHSFGTITSARWLTLLR